MKRTNVLNVLINIAENLKTLLIVAYLAMLLIKYTMENVTSSIQKVYSFNYSIYLKYCERLLWKDCTRSLSMLTIFIISHN